MVVWSDEDHLGRIPARSACCPGSREARSDLDDFGLAQVSRHAIEELAREQPVILQSHCGAGAAPGAGRRVQSRFRARRLRRSRGQQLRGGT
jgi:hypothetical protein